MNILADSLALNKMKKIHETIQAMKGNKEWYNQIVSKADKLKRPLQEVQTEDAEWMFEKKSK
ncbi:MAG: hypothetical protein IPP29_04265 [Bacteroidetes bacterium]|nr:hypothetical protein [Bacteroidota bacterium]